MLRLLSLHGMGNRGAHCFNPGLIHWKIIQTCLMIQLLDFRQRIPRGIFWCCGMSIIILRGLLHARTTGLQKYLFKAGHEKKGVDFIDYDRFITCLGFWFENTPFYRACWFLTWEFFLILEWEECVVEADFDFILPNAWLRQVWILNPGFVFLKFGFWMLDFLWKSRLQNCF